MALTAFTSALGVSQGRIANGSTARFVLGSDVPGSVHRLADGDYVTVSQTGNAGLAKFIRGRLSVRPASATPEGVTWFAEALVAGEVRWQQAITETRDYDDFGVSVADQLGDYALTFRLRVSGSDGPWELELPAFYIAELELNQTTDELVLLNRSPYPDEQNVPRNAAISLEVSSASGEALSLADTTITVADVTVYQSGSYLAGFTGSTTSLGHGTRRFRFTVPTDSFTSSELVVVRVQTQTDTGTPSYLDATYSFQVIDFEEPELSTSVGRGRKIIRATFSEPVRMTGDGSSTDALTPGNWTITLLEGPIGVTPIVTGVSVVDATTVDLTTDIEMSHGAAYLLSAFSIVDLAGNSVVAPNNSATFTGFTPFLPADRDFDLLSMVPDMNVAEDHDGDLRNLISVMQELTDQMLVDVDEWTDLLDPDIAPERFLDTMLRDLGNPFEFELSETDKRRLSKLLIPIYRQKGTSKGILNAIRFFLGYEFTIEVPFHSEVGLGDAVIGDTFVLGGTGRVRFTFHIVSPTVLPQHVRDRVLSIANYMKPAQTHVELVEPSEPITIDHAELGLSELGENFLLH